MRRVRGAAMVPQKAYNFYMNSVPCECMRSFTHLCLSGHRVVTAMTAPSPRPIGRGRKSSSPPSPLIKDESENSNICPTQITPNLPTNENGFSLGYWYNLKVNKYKLKLVDPSTV